MPEKYATFEGWWEAVLQTAEEEDLAVNPDDPEAYRPFYDDGLSPLDALVQDSCG